MTYHRAALSSLLLTSLAACGGGQSSGSATGSVAPVTVVATPPATAEATPAPTPSPTPAPTAVPASSPSEAPTSGAGQSSGSLALPTPTEIGAASPCTGNYAQTDTSSLPEITVKSGGVNGWDERYVGRPLSLLNARIDHCETFDGSVSLAGPMLFARGHSDFGNTKFDAAGGAAYTFANGKLVLNAYQDASDARSGLVQSVSSTQAYQAAMIQPNQSGYTCAGCYWEARMKMPTAWGTWAAFWLLSPDDPKNRGHLEVDGIEYYGLGNKRGHHHAIHRWQSGKSSGNFSGYSLSDTIGDGDWHTYGIDLRGIARIDGKPAIVIYMDGKEVDRLVADADYFTSPFYYLVNLATKTPKTGAITYPQSLEVDYITAWKPRG
ncbi:MAG: family 16 glycosylhydrolase [Sphingomonas phyllosphaerae]